MKKTINFKSPEKQFQKCPECRGILSVGKHRDKPICRKCRGRGWVYEVPQEPGIKIVSLKVS